MKKDRVKLFLKICAVHICVLLFVSCNSVMDDAQSKVPESLGFEDQLSSKYAGIYLRVKMKGAKYDELQVSYGPLDSIPIELRDLRDLRVLDLSHNRIQSISNRQVSLLQNLEELNLNDNHLDRIPDLSSLQNLLVLRLRGNALAGNKVILSKLPPSLRFLDLSHNDINELLYHDRYGLPENLQGIDLSHNYIRRISPELCNENTGFEILVDSLHRAYLNMPCLRVPSYW